jgi:hypothetical protein
LSDPITQSAEAHPRAFAVQYRDAAVPRLITVCWIHGPRIARGTETTDAACRAAWRIARHLGADHLLPAYATSLKDWIRAKIDEESERARANRAPWGRKWL